MIWTVEASISSDGLPAAFPDTIPYMADGLKISLNGRNAGFQMRGLSKSIKVDLWPVATVLLASATSDRGESGQLTRLIFKRNMTRLPAMQQMTSTEGDIAESINLLC